MLADFDVSKLVCVDEDDTLLDSAGVECVAAQTPNADLERFVECEHGPFLEKPEKFNRVLTNFVDSCAS